ncbi:molecular chaperone GrpE [Dyadobacter jejuensis]|uniref:Protein GrpE n=1 Tax=Dyadobacter jejuensis TaxID=1082580 RepID=A0A316AIN7_9BACT|nr:nucleotide exchange factor GrpE [Dyadobacter jejuensis]PWJ57138.1 molecular chaperone GrpE [Dyadobacter jejuensis]
MPENKEQELENAENTADMPTDADNLEDAQTPAEAPVEGPEALDPLDAAKLEVSELKDKYLRLYADFENFRRRTAKEKLEMFSSANADMMKAMLPIVDDFERANQSFETSNNLEALKEGVDLIYSKLIKTLESKGLKPMSAKGEAFDAELHDSIAQFPAPTEDLKGKVVDEIEKGYYLNDKVIRFAKVVVGS